MLTSDLLYKVLVYDMQIYATKSITGTQELVLLSWEKMCQTFLQFHFAKLCSAVVVFW
jgi:hypothetical protein